MARVVTLNHISFGAVLALVALGCQSPFESEVVRTLKPATIEFYGDSTEALAPAAVFAGEPFEVTVQSFGDGCVSFGETRVTMSRLRADIRPYDFEVTHAPRNYACPDILTKLSHTVTLTFAERGRVLLWIHGRRRPDGSAVSVVRAVDVR